MNILPPSLTMRQFTALTNVSATTAYAGIRNNTFPVPFFRVNSRIVIPTKPLMDLLGLTKEEILSALESDNTPTAA